VEPLLVKSPTVKHPNDISPDGQFLIFDEHHPERFQDLYVLPLTPGPSGQRTPIPVVVTPADDTFGQFSPDGKWIAYTSNDSGRREVYVQRFAPDRVPAVGERKWQISTAGGDKPRWAPGGNELFYVAPDRKMMAVPIKTSGDSFEPGIAAPLFPTNLISFFPYDVGADGRFLIPAPIDLAAQLPITVILNWRPPVP
jgi:dipeptidyl aminopeptidase/acylaminoacyl peptidase